MSSPMQDKDGEIINHHPDPAQTKSQCPACNKKLPAPRCGQALGKVLTNYGRWYQMCYAECDYIHWFNDPTPVERIPDSVVLQFTKRKSAQEAHVSMPCEEPNCLTTDGKPRTANKLCSRSPQCCMTCCRSKSLVDGLGCKKHRIEENRVIQQLHKENQPSPSLDRSPSQLVSPPFAQSSAALSTQKLDSPSRRIYGRALDEGYARNRLDPALERLRVREAHSEEIVASQKVLAALKNTLTVIFWTEAGVPPTRVNVLLQFPNILSIKDHSFIMDSYKALDIQTAAYLDTAQEYPLIEWIIQDISIPVLLNPDQTSIVLMRPAKLSPTECLYLEVKILEVFQRKSHAVQGPVVRKRLHQDAFDNRQTSNASASDEANPSVDTTQSQVSQAGSPSQPPAKRVSYDGVYAHFPGPLRYVSELAAGLEHMNLTKTTDAMIQAFKHHFPGYQPVIATMYRYRNIYSAAQKANLVDKYKSYGRTPNGEWTRLKKEVETLKKQGAISNRNSTPLPKSPLHLDIAIPRSFDDSDEDPGSPDNFNELFEPLSIVEERLRYDNGVIVSFIENLNKTQQVVFFLKPLAVGSIHDVHCVMVSESKDMILKKLRIPETWWAKNECSHEMAIFLDAERLFYAAGLAQAFVTLAKSKGVEIYDFKFADTFLVQHIGTDAITHMPKTHAIFIGQENLHGQRFQSQILGQIDEEIGQTLAAFQHYVYNSKHGDMAIDNFQGFISKDKCLTVYDCGLHVALHYNEDELGNERFYFHNQHRFGIERFQHDHGQCSEICKALGFLPVVAA